MNELIVIEDGLLTISKETALKLIDFENRLKDMQEQEKALKAAILAEMEKHDVKKLDFFNLSITYKAAYDRESFDSKAFRAEHPDMYDSYVSMTTVKPSVVIKVK